MVVHRDKLADFASAPFQGTVTGYGCPVAAHCFWRGPAATRGPYAAAAAVVRGVLAKMSMTPLW